MKDKFIESIKEGVIKQVEEIIKESTLQAERKDLNAIDTLELVNNNINDWISTINGIINIDDELLYEIAIRKKPLVQAAKKEVANKVSKIIENEQYDVTSKINEYINNLKERGISLDGDIEEKITKEESTVDTNVIDDSYNIPPLFDNNRQFVLRREPKKRNRDFSDEYVDTSCGRGSSCC